MIFKKLLKLNYLKIYVKQISGSDLEIEKFN